MKPPRQYAALPFIYLDEQVEVCLITSRTTGRWIIPKGWPQDGLAPHELAAVEAYEEAGLKGERRGGAMISPKHANFIVNTGGATADDILALMALAREKVEERTGIQLEPEIRLAG